MSSNVETLRAAHDAFSTNDLDRAAGLVATDARVTDYGNNRSVGSREEFRGWMEGFHSMASDIRIVDATYHDGGDWVTARFRVVGTQDGPAGEFPASGRSFSLDVCEVWHFNADGNADEGYNYSDSLGLLMQLGHIGQPA